MMYTRFRAGKYIEKLSAMPLIIDPSTLPDKGLVESATRIRISLICYWLSNSGANSLFLAERCVSPLR